ncbi:MAG: hypothetical protein R2867_12860 [Caldilineaceae bacterium]
MTDAQHAFIQLLPTMILHGGIWADGLNRLRNTLTETFAMITPAGWFCDLARLAAPWDGGTRDADAVRCSRLPALIKECWRAGSMDVEWLYRFRDLVVIQGRKAPSPTTELRHVS